MAARGVYETVKQAIQDVIAPDLERIKGQLTGVDGRLAGVDVRISALDFWRMKPDPLLQETMRLFPLFEMLSTGGTVPGGATGLRKSTKTKLNSASRRVTTPSDPPGAT